MKFIRRSKYEGSANFRGITRKRWLELYNKGRVELPIGMHNPKYSALQPYLPYFSL